VLEERNVQKVKDGEENPEDVLLENVQEDKDSQENQRDV